MAQSYFTQFLDYFHYFPDYFPKNLLKINFITIIITLIIKIFVINMLLICFNNYKTSYFSVYFNTEHRCSSKFNDG